MTPLPKEKRHPADYRDEIEHSEVAAALSELPADHPACVAYSNATISDSIALSQLLADRMDIVDRLVAAYRGHSNRILGKARGASHLFGRR